MASNSATSAADIAARELILTRVFDAPRELVFDAWTDPKHVAEWWGPRGYTITLTEMDVRTGGVWKFDMHGPDGTVWVSKADYIEVVKPERLVYMLGDEQSGDEGSFHVTVTFTEQGDKTLLRLRMLMKTAEQREQAVAFGAIPLGEQTLDKFGEFLATRSR